MDFRLSMFFSFVFICEMLMKKLLSENVTKGQHYIKLSKYSGFFLNHR